MLELNIQQEPQSGLQTISYEYDAASAATSYKELASA